MMSMELQNNSELSGQSATFQPRDFLAILFRRKHLFFFLAIPFFIAVFLYHITRPYAPVYLASFDIVITKEQPIGGIFSPYASPRSQTDIITQRIISNLLSVNFTQKIVDSLSLSVIVKEPNHDINFETKYKEDFEKPLGPYRLEIQNQKYRLLKDENILKEGNIEDDVDLGHLVFRIKPVVPLVEKKTLTITFFPHSRIALALRNSIAINVLEAGKIDKGIGTGGLPGSGEGVTRRLISGNPEIDISGILRINVYWGNPAIALNIARILSNQIIKEDIEEKSKQYVQSKNFIDSQLKFYKDRLNELEQEIKKFKATNKVSDLSARAQSLINQISILESQKNQIAVEENVIQRLMSFVNKGESDSLPNLATGLISSPALREFYAQLAQAEAELKSFLKEYSDEHPKVFETKSRISGLKTQLKEEISRRISSIRTDIEGIDAQINQLQEKLDSMPETEINLARLERDQKTAEKLYTFFAEKLEEVRVQEAGVTSDLKIINPPITTNRPINRRGILTSFLFSLVLGIFVGAAGVVIAEYFDTAIRDVEVIKKRLGLPVYGSIPRAEYGSKLKSIPLDPSSMAFEAFRKVTLNLDFAHPEKKYNVIYITSPGPEEGKTFITLNLGLVSGAVGKKTVIVDTDFRKKKKHLTDVVFLKKAIGLFDVLKGEVSLKDTLVEYNTKSIPAEGDNQITEDAKDYKPLPANSVHILPLGRLPPNPFVFLESKRMEEIVQMLREEYNYVIIDGLPLLLFADASYIARISDGVLLVTQYGKTTIKELEESKEILSHAGANIIGVVVNNIPYSRDTYYYHYYHKYYSKYYSK